LQCSSANAKNGPGKCIAVVGGHTTAELVVLLNVE